MDPKKSRMPALVLFFLSPAVGELLSGSAPPAEFFNPFTLLLLGVLYGGGAILVRELRVRWNKGWPTVLALGAAYGIVEEGLMVKSFFDPHWMDLGLLGSYGRWAGVNWVWSLELTLYHAVFSIAIPILLAEMLFPYLRDQSWVGRRGRRALALFLLGDVLLGFFLLTPYRPPWLPYLLAAAAVVLLYRLARQLPARWSVPTANSVPRPRRFALVGFLATVAFFATFWVLPELGLPVPITLAAGLLLPVLVARAVRRLTRGGMWAAEHQLALAAGALGFFVLLAPLMEMDGTRPDNPAGMTVVGLGALLFLIWLWRRMRRHALTGQPAH